MEYYGIIPARYQSTRLPGKPLALIGGVTMIERVYKQCLQSKVLSKVAVATEDERIANVVVNFGGNVIMTDMNHPSGTDRCFEAANALDIKDTANAVIINIQGDEPFINPAQIDLLSTCFASGATDIATLVKIITKDEDLDSATIAKVVLDDFGRAMYFSRSPIPYLRNVERINWLNEHIFYKHIGIYAYKYEVLKQIVGLKQGKLEVAESLEQLRWLEHGFNIAAKITDYESFAIDTPADLKIANTMV
jgi:3-deoxy-manno-octulosonate cytidylyltransferase (CMP-KDO synthetase)